MGSMLNHNQINATPWVQNINVTVRLGWVSWDSVRDSCLLTLSALYNYRNVLYKLRGDLFTNNNKIVNGVLIIIIFINAESNSTENLKSVTYTIQT